LSQFLFHNRPALCPDPGLALPTLLHGLLVRLLRTIAAFPCIPAQFPPNGRSMNANFFGNLTRTNTYSLHGRNLVSLFLGKLSVVSHKRSFDLAVSGGYVCDLFARNHS